MWLRKVDLDYLIQLLSVNHNPKNLDYETEFNC